MRVCSGASRLFHIEIAGIRTSYSTAELDGQLRGLVLQNISNAIASSGIAFLDLVANLAERPLPDEAGIGRAQ